MLSSLRFQSSNLDVALRPPIWKNAFPINIYTQRSSISCTKRATLPQPLCSLTAQSIGPPSNYISTVGSSPLQLSQWNPTQRHLTLLQAFACVTAICSTWLFFSAIPALLAFKKAAESLEKLMDATREELPNTMASIRLSGMEISDLTTELSDLGQELTQGVRSSTRVVRSAEQRLRSITTMPSSSSSSVSLQGMGRPEAEAEAEPEPAVARAARGMREGIVKGRAILKMFFSLAGFSRLALNFITRRRKS